MGFPRLQAREDVKPISETVSNRESVVRSHLDPGEAQAFALADRHDGRLLTDDGVARSFAKDQGVAVVGSVGVLLAAIDADRIDETTADRCSKRGSMISDSTSPIEISKTIARPYDGRIAFV